MSDKIAILTDSTAYIPDELLEKYDIHIIPLIVNWNDESFLDNVDITPEVFYDRLPKEKELPTSSQPSAGAFKSRIERPEIHRHWQRYGFSQEVQRRPHPLRDRHRQGHPRR